MKTIENNKFAKKIFLTLINDEREKRIVLSAKACNTIFSDYSSCQNGATDTCPQTDSADCVGMNALDVCKYVDEDYCIGVNAKDRCDYDYNIGPDCNLEDYCIIDA